MTVANVHEAKTNLSKLLDDAAEGKEVVITRRGGVITRFRLTPMRSKHTNRAAFGTYKDKIAFAPDYDAADQEITKLFEQNVDD